MKTEEDEAFEAIEKSQGWRKRQVDSLIEEDMDNPCNSTVKR